MGERSVIPLKRVLCVLLMCFLALPALAETVQDQALAFIQEAGIVADGVNRIGDEIIVTLAGGGTAALYSPGDFDKYDLSWRFDGAADEDVVLYLDHALTLLFALEAKIPADTENLSAAQAMRVRNYAAMIDKGLLALENLGQQGLNVLLLQMESQPDSELNGLRARLAERLLNILDKVPVDLQIKSDLSY